MCVLETSSNACVCDFACVGLGPWLLIHCVAMLLTQHQPTACPAAPTAPTPPASVTHLLPLLWHCCCGIAATVYDLLPLLWCMACCRRVA
jgi:hypothetical protein